MLKTLSALGICLLLSAACSLKKTAENTAKTTKEMNETTKDMRKDTKDVKGTSEELRDKTNSLKSNMTYDIAHARMSDHLDRLFRETAAHNTGLIKGTWDFFFGKNEEPDLLADAGFIIYAMFFQFWEGQPDEDLAELDERIEVGVELLFDRMFKHIPRDSQVDVLRPGASYKGVAAIGAKMDLIHSRHERGLVRRGLPRMSLYDYVIQALRNREAFKRVENTPKAIAKILQWEHEAVYTLQLRHNILPVMVVARITDFQDRKDLRRLWMWWRGQKVDLSKANPEQLREWTDWLNKASQTRKDLRSAGIEPQYNKMLMQMVEGVDFGQAELIANRQPTAQQMVLRDFAVAYRRAVQETKAANKQELATPAEDLYGPYNP